MRELKGIKIGKHYIEKPIIQGGMGVGISWDQLAGNVSKNGGLGTISAICTGYYQNMKFVKKQVEGRPLGTENAYSREALFEIFKNARQICGDKPLACNILHAINDYERVVNDALEAGANIIVTGAGLPLELPRLTENYPDVEIVPIVSSARALKIICKKWKAAGRTPGAVIVEGPKSGGHQGAKYDELFAPEHQLEAILPPIKEERDKWGDFPIIAAGGIWDRDDIEKIMDLGADAVQMGTRFIGTHECDASPVLKQVLLDSKEEDIVIVKSPAGFPGRAIRNKFTERLDKDGRIPVRYCVDCILPCNPKNTVYCITEALINAVKGDIDNGLIFSGTNAYRIDKITTVKELISELVSEANNELR